MALLHQERDEETARFGTKPTDDKDHHDWVVDCCRRLDLREEGRGGRRGSEYLGEEGIGEEGEDDLRMEKRT